VALIEPEGEQRKLFRVTPPSPIQMQYGDRVISDKEPPISGAFFTCFIGSICNEISKQSIAETRADPNKAWTRGSCRLRVRAQRHQQPVHTGRAGSEAGADRHTAMDYAYVLAEADKYCCRHYV
jgi:hypothetical protein